jgi:hypothetical protein
MDDSEIRSMQSSTSVDKPVFGDEVKELIERTGWKGFLESVGFEVEEIRVSGKDGKEISKKIIDLMAQLSESSGNKVFVFIPREGKPQLVHVSRPTSEGETSK